MDNNQLLNKKWELDLGSNLLPEGKVKFRVWAPSLKKINVINKDNKIILTLEKDEDGYFNGITSNIKIGEGYKYQINDGESFPDPVSRYLPEGPNAYTQIVDPNQFNWTDQSWSGIENLQGQVIYELHIGCFTNEGTFDAALNELEELRNLGITVIELMPICEFPGDWNLGYDGVSFYAPFHKYGDYEALKRFVDKAHQLKIAVILDVVYNHFGPLYNYLSKFSSYYFSKKYTSDWGEVLNLDESGSKEVREFIIKNAIYWIMEFHLDGFRIDSTQNFPDDSTEHILKEMIYRSKETASPRKIIVIAENNAADMKLIRPKEKDGFGFDGIWIDDFHHVSIVASLGRGEAFYQDYRGVSQEYINLFKKGILFQGQRSWNKPSQGTPVKDEPSCAFIFSLQNHDQISNELRGERLHQLIDPSRNRVLSAILLLAPETPLIFMGQEFAASSPFPFFADYSDQELSIVIAKGRKKFLEQFPSHNSAFLSSEAPKFLPNCCDKKCFVKSKLDFSERAKNKSIYKMFHDLLKLRREDSVIRTNNRFTIEGAALNPACFVIRYFGSFDDDRILVINLSKELRFKSMSEPLLAPCKNKLWETIWSSENPNYGGNGVIDPHQKEEWVITGLSATVLKSTSEIDKPLMEKKFKNHS